MLSFISAKEAADKWEISQRRVATLCAEKRIDGAMMVGNMWIIPSTAEKPEDKRVNKVDVKLVGLKPFIKWVGGKSQLVAEIEKVIPSDMQLSKYAEPMVGGGALLFNMLANHNFKEVYICDTNAELINVYNVVKNDVEKLIEQLIEMQTMFLAMNANGRKFYY
ncbi:MAG: DNA adenine methylase, partial [Clostridia bacterium]|nr:DNA adenine methylase [Clostridia bacterium]